MADPTSSPRPELVAEAKAMIDRWKRGSVGREHVSVPVGLTYDCAEFAAWVELRNNMAKQRNDHPLFRQIELSKPDGSPGRDWEYLEDFVCTAVNEKVSQVIAELEAGTHPLLFLKPEVVRQDDDIPFD